LQDDKGAAKPRLAPQETQFLICIKFAQHSAHRHSDGQPFADLQRPIDAHPNQEDAKLTLHCRRHSFRDD
jgi:hypothetical protein